MTIKASTERLFLRELDHGDEADLFEMDSNAEVHRYIENKPVQSMDEIRNVIAMLKMQYAENGIARWAVVIKETGECIGWCGLKYIKEPVNGHTNFYELGYRFKRKHWGKGYATEASQAVMNYGKDTLNLHTIYAITDPGNKASKHVLEKLGFTYRETFDDEGSATDWFEWRK